MMMIDPNNPAYRAGLAPAGVAIYAVQGYFRHQVFIKKKTSATWSRGGEESALSRFAYASWAAIFLIFAIDFIDGAISVGGGPHFLGALYILSIVAIPASAIYDYSRHAFSRKTPPERTLAFRPCSNASSALESLSAFLASAAHR